MTPRHLKRAASLATRIVGYGLAAVIVVLLALNLLAPRLTRTVPLTVFTGSMTPTIPTGSLVYVRAAEVEDLVVGDIITFESAPESERYTTHRIVAIDDSGDELSFTTKGDANAADDIDPVPAAAVRGQVVFHVPVVGSVSDHLRSPTALAALLTISIGGFIVSTLQPRLARRRPAEADADADIEIEVDDLPLVVETPRPGTGVALDPPLFRSELVIDPRRITQQVLLATVHVPAGHRKRLVETVELLHGSMLDMNHNAIVITIAGTPQHLDDVEKLLAPWSPADLQRSSIVGTEAPDPAEAPMWRDGATGRSASTARQGELEPAFADRLGAPARWAWLPLRAWASRARARR